MKPLWQQLNRPLVVLLVGFALWPLVSAWKERLTVHSAADAVFQELGRAQDQMQDQAKQSGIKKLVESFVSQFVDGFSDAFDRMGSKQESKFNDFTSVLKQVTITEAKVGPGQFESNDKVIGIIRNDSAKSISSLHLNLTLFGADGQLLDVVDKDLNDLKVLLPGQAVGFAVDRDLNVPSPNRDENDSDGSDSDQNDSDKTDPAKKAAAQARKKAEAARQATYKAALEAHRAVKVTAQIVGFSVDEPPGK